MSNVDFNTINTLEGFKSFLQTYHKHLTNSRSFPPLGLQKSLHTAAPVFGFNDWNVMSAALVDKPTAEPESIQVVVITLMEIDNDTDETRTVDTTVVRNWEKAKEYVADLVYSKAMGNDKSAEEILECRSIRTPEDGESEELEGRDLLDWIVDNNDVDDLISLVAHLDYNLTRITAQDHWV